MFTNGSFDNMAHNIYKLESKVDEFSYYQSSSVVREAVMVRDKVNSQFSDATRASTVHNENIEFRFSDKVVYDILLSLIFANDAVQSGDIKHSESPRDFTSYIACTLNHYLLSQIRNKQNLKLKKIKYRLTLTRNLDSSDDLHAIYSGLINKGLIMPMSPLHYQYYLDGSINSDWTKYCVYSLCSTPHHLPLFKRILPCVNSDVRSKFRSVMIRPELRAFRDFYPTDLLPCFPDVNGGMSKSDIIRELFVRLMCKDDLESFLPLYTRAG